MHRRLSPIMVAALLVALLPSAANASVTTSCSFEAGTATVTAIIGSGDDPTLVRDDAAITFGGAVCGAATVTNTDTINIADADPNSGESLAISLAGGRLVPGKTAEDDGTDEIEISIAQSFPGSLTLVGSDAADNFYVCAGDINLNTNVSGDSEIFLPTNTTITIVDGGMGNDVLRTKMWESVVSGGGGDDVLYPMDYGPSSYDGGPGNDELSYSSQAADGWGEIHALGGGDATIVRSFSVSDSAHGVETFEGFDGPTRFYGSAEADHFLGTKYNDWFLPLGGDDSIDGGPSFVGTTGTFDVDVLSVGASTAVETFDMSAQTATGEGTDTFQHIEALQASPQDDVFEGNPGRAGLMQIDGNGGYDVLDLSAVLKPQTVFVGTRVPPEWLWATAIAEVIGTKRADIFTFHGGDTRVRFLGGDGNDTLVGGRLNDVLVGGAGDDTINGKGGTDTCDGGPGADMITNCERS